MKGVIAHLLAGEGDPIEGKKKKKLMTQERKGTIAGMCNQVDDI